MENKNEILKEPNQIEEYDYEYFCDLATSASKMKCEEIIKLHQSLIGKKYKDDEYIGDYGRKLIFNLLNYGWGKSIAIEFPQELSKFFNSKHVSDYFKQIIKTSIVKPSEIVLNAINSERNFIEFTEEEFDAIENALNEVGFHNVMLIFASKLDSDGAANFLNNKVDPMLLIKSIIERSGLNSRPDFYSGRGTMRCDLNEDMLISIYNKLAKIDKNKALNMAKMTFNMPTLGATEFLQSLYNLVYNNYNLDENVINENNISLGNSRGMQRNVVAMASIMSAFGGYRRNETESIKSSFKNLLSEDVIAIIFGNNQSYRYDELDDWEGYKYSRRKR